MAVGTSQRPTLRGALNASTRLHCDRLLAGYCHVGLDRAVVGVGGLAGVASLASVTDLPSYISLNQANSVNDSDRIVGWGKDRCSSSFQRNLSPPFGIRCQPAGELIDELAHRSHAGRDPVCPRLE